MLPGMNVIVGATEYVTVRTSPLANGNTPTVNPVATEVPCLTMAIADTVPPVTATDPQNGAA